MPDEMNLRALMTLLQSQFGRDDARELLVEYMCFCRATVTHADRAMADQRRRQAQKVRLAMEAYRAMRSGEQFGRRARFAADLDDILD